MQSNMSICDEQPSVLAEIEAETVQPSKKKRQRRSMRKSRDEARSEAQVELHHESTVQPRPEVRPKKKCQSRSDEPEVIKKKCQTKAMARKRSGADETQPEESQPKKKRQMKVMNDFSLVLPSLTGVAIFASLLSHQLSILQGHTKCDITCLLRSSTL